MLWSSQRRIKISDELNRVHYGIADNLSDEHTQSDRLPLLL